MDDERALEFPATGAVVDLIAASRTEPFMTWAVASAGKELLVLVPLDHEQRPVNLAPGERLDVVWRSPAELLCLPMTLAAVLPDKRPCWRLRVAGVVQRGQRRDAVRAPIVAPVRLGVEPALFSGVTVDVSEGGLRCVLDSRPSLHGGLFTAEMGPPEVGHVVRITAMLPEMTISCAAEIARRHPRKDGRIELSVRFIGLSEFEEDNIRRRVFARLRDLRQRGML
jgi:hypothetical protein